MDSIILFCCSFVSSIITVNILFQFLNDRYIKVFHNKFVYAALPIVNILIIATVNLFMNPVINLISNIGLTALSSFAFYYEENSRKIMRLFEAEALFAVMAVLEALGVFGVDFIMKLFHIMPQSREIQKSIETAFSQLVLLFLYYVIFTKLWKKNILRTKIQYILYFIMFMYSVINILVIAIIYDKENSLVIMVIVGCTIFANMYLLYFIKFSDERNYYKMQVEMMKQQQEIQYENYEIQNEKYKDAMVILHDVEKHIKVIEGLYLTDLEHEAINYTKQIGTMLRPLVPVQYSDNPIMNCLLADKKRVADNYNILLKVEILEADINFMKSIDITTLFGNLIDNAITANKHYNGSRYIGLFAKEYNEMISIRIENCVGVSVNIKNGKLISENKKGIGLLNIQRCVERYEGSIIYKCTEQMLICDIILNKRDGNEEFKL